MGKITLALMFAVAILALGPLTWNADAQSWKRGAAGLAGQNYTPLQNAACRGGGPHCPPGRTWVCRGGACWCAPC